jgi:hypothetical protein
MIKKVVNECEDVITIDTVKKWIRDRFARGCLDSYIVIGIGFKKPYILKYVEGKFAWFSLDNSWMTLNGIIDCENFISYKMGQDSCCDEIYVLDNLGDLVELLKRFI